MSIPPDISREEVNSNCDRKINYSWTYNRCNASPIPSGVTNPDWLASTTTYPTSLAGIPYCFGGFDSATTAHSRVGWAKYGDAVSQPAFAGNINSSDNYKSGTAGMDCSGFVSACVGWGVHRNTVSIWDNQSYAISSPQRLRMNIYIHHTAHVLYYYSDYAEGVSSKESTTSGTDKCKAYARMCVVEA